MQPKVLDQYRSNVNKCKECESRNRKAYRAANPEKVKEQDRRDRLKRFESGAHAIAAKHWRDNNPEAAKAIRQRDHLNSMRSGRAQAYKVQRELQDPARHKEEQKAARMRRKENGKTREWVANKKQIDASFRLAANLRSRVSQAILHGKGVKSASTVELLGCSVEELRGHLQSQFQLDMGWHNYGQWHVDHKIPCASFDLTSIEQQRACFHFTNLQPLWAADNCRKGARFENQMLLAK